MQQPPSTQALQNLKAELTKSHDEIESKKKELAQKQGLVKTKEVELNRLKEEVLGLERHLEELNVRMREHNREMTTMQQELEKLIKGKK